MASHIIIHWRDYVLGGNPVLIYGTFPFYGDYLPYADRSVAFPGSADKPKSQKHALTVEAAIAHS